MGEVDYFRKKLNTHLADYRHASRVVKEEKSKLHEVGIHLTHVEKARELTQEVARGVQQQAHARIASVVSRCLEAVFGEDAYEFRIVFESKRGRTEAKLVFVRDGYELENPLREAGGGVIDVAGFALRLACLMLSTPRKRKFLALDEPFKHLSGEHVPAVRNLLLTLAKEMDVQFLMVTHRPGIKIGKVVEL